MIDFGLGVWLTTGNIGKSTCPRRGVEQCPAPIQARRPRFKAQKLRFLSPESRLKKSKHNYRRSCSRWSSAKHPDTRFLEFAVKKTLAGESDEIKEYLIGLEVFDRQPDFDPSGDPIVRAEARRLRSRLADYYNTIGELDPVQIELPKGTYVPVFSQRNGHETSPAPEAPIATVQSLVAAVPHSRRRFLASGIALALVVSLLAGYTFYRHRTAGTRTSDASSASPVRVRRSVAVLGFANLSGRSDSAWLSTGLSEMMTTELGAGGNLLTIPDETVAYAKTELHIGNANGLSRDTLKRIRDNLNADVVVSGAYTVLPPVTGSRQESGQFRLDLRIQNAATGETLDSISATGAESDLFQMVARTGAAARSDLGVEELRPVRCGGGEGCGVVECRGLAVVCAGS